MFYKIITSLCLIAVFLFLYKLNTYLKLERYHFTTADNLLSAINKSTGEVYIYIPKHGWTTYHQAISNTGELPEDELKKLP